MSSSFSSDPQEIDFILGEFKKSIMKDRKEYKDLVFRLYKEKPLLYRGKDRTDPSVITKEFREYYEIIGHCLIIGDSDALYEFGIKPLEESVDYLARPDKLDDYIKVFEKRFERENEDAEEGMKFYLAMLIRAFKLVRGDNILNPVLNVE